MDLMTKRLKVTIRFAVVCSLINAIAISLMALAFYLNIAINDYEEAKTTNFINNEPNVAIIDNASSNIVYTNLVNKEFYKIPNEEELLEIISETVEPTEIVEETTELVEVTEPTVDSTEPELTEEVEATSPEPTEEEVEVTEPEKEKVLKYKYGRRMTPAVDIDVPTGDDMKNHTDEVDTSSYEYIGTYSITGYTPKCAHCCGSTKGITASGVEAIAGYTVATTSHLPFGTTLYIEGYGYYVVEDRGGMSKNVIDIAAPNHDACYPLTNNGVNVYIVHHKN